MCVCVCVCVCVISQEERVAKAKAATAALEANSPPPMDFRAKLDALAKVWFRVYLGFRV